MNLAQTWRLSRERELLNLVKKIETPFMESLQREYGEQRGWRMCGPASIALSRVLSTQTGIPIGQDIEGEHIELTVGIFDPEDQPNRRERIEEQTYIRYHTGNGYVYYIDPIYGLLMQGKKEFHEAIQVERYSIGEIDNELVRRHHLYPFDPNHHGIADSLAFRTLKSASERQLYIDDSIAALNDERATMPEFVSDSGHIMSTDWQKTEGIIKEFAPEWQIDMLTKLERLQEVAQHMIGDLHDSQRSSGLSPFSMPLKLESFKTTNRSELIYHDQSPTVEHWNMGRNEETVLTFHINNQRYILKEGESLQIYENGRQKAVTEAHLQAVHDAVYATKDEKTISFFSTQIKNTQLKR